MKLRMKLLTVAVIAALATAVPALAADGSQAQLNVPFSFVVEGQTLPAGSYTVAQDGNLLYIRGPHGAVLVSGGPVSYSPNFQAKLVFEREKGVAYLKGVQISNEAFQIPTRTAMAVPIH